MQSMRGGEGNRGERGSGERLETKECANRVQHSSAFHSAVYSFLTLLMQFEIV
jgi:hypothetical protein